ncbi:neutrophil defensin 1 preproprotein [Daubentonia madagascariensis]|uniref:Neutrophil defensin 1 preproprotein n=1 Tax=Daubentonia madagascariensis TaxID=31869 RepID=A0ABD2D4A3_DAUMA
MRTLALLAALLLVALQAQAGPLQERAEDDEAPDQELPGDEDKDVAVSITLNENSIPQAPGLVRGMACFCRISSCLDGETRLGTCHFGGNVYTFCC